MSDKSVLQECPARVSHKNIPPTRVFRKSAPQEGPKRVPYKSAPQECRTRVSHKTVSHKTFLQECPTRVSVVQECPTRVSDKSVPQLTCPARVHHKSVPQEYPAEVATCSSASYKSVLQECPTEWRKRRVRAFKSVLKECFLQECKSVGKCLAVCLGVHVCIRVRGFVSVLLFSGLRIGHRVQVMHVAGGWFSDHCLCNLCPQVPPNQRALYIYIYLSMCGTPQTKKSLN